MRHDYELQEDVDCDIYERMQRLIEKNPWAWQSIGAVSGLVGGVLTPVIGTLLILAAWYIHSERIVSSLNGLSIGSFVLTIPLLTFGAHCLDLLERKTASISPTEKQPAVNHCHPYPAGKSAWKELRRDLYIVARYRGFRRH